MRLSLSSVVTWLMLCSATASAVSGSSPGQLWICCDPEHELLRVLRQNHIQCTRLDTFTEAASAAPANSGVLVLATDYPHRRTHIDATALQLARDKHLRLYLEFPDGVPGYEMADTPTHTKWERAVVTSNSLLSSVPPLTILSISGCDFLQSTASRSILSIARVAGYDRAIYGLPADAKPLLFAAPELGAVVATTRLSTFISGRYGPTEEWEKLWQDLLRHLMGGPVPQLHVESLVHPRFSETDPMPSNFQQRALRASAKWLMKSDLLPDRGRSEKVHDQLIAGAEDDKIPLDAKPGDGSFGILEGYSSAIQVDGSQRQRLPVRADCQAESAMLLAMNACCGGSLRQSTVARRLLHFLYETPTFYTAGRNNPKSAAYGLIAWGAYAPSWEVANYGDDNARVLLGSLAAAAVLKEKRWDASILRGIVANFRTTGRTGFRGDRIDMPELSQHDWHFFADRELTNLAPHFESWLWACYLFAYQQTKYEPFLQRTLTGISKTMDSYPGGWRLKDNSERSRMLLCLAWLIRVNDTPEHRAWLDRVATDLLTNMFACGGIAEHLGGSGAGHYQVPQSNEAYGKGECPLLQENGDPVTDQLYTSGFALLGLHEAAAVTTNPVIAVAEEKLARYLCRIQVSSPSVPYLDGAWLRGFDFEKWDYWANSCDPGWGPWCAEAGWGPTWTGTTLGLRERKQTLWSLLAAHKVTKEWDQIQRTMLGGLP